MTGFARVRKATPDGEIAVGIKSVNHRGLDMHFHMAAELDPFEGAIRNAVKAKVARGHLQIHVAFNPHCAGGCLQPEPAFAAGLSAGLSGGGRRVRRGGQARSERGAAGAGNAAGGRIRGTRCRSGAGAAGSHRGSAGSVEPVSRARGRGHGGRDARSDAHRFAIWRRKWRRSGRARHKLSKRD
jgi:hypothetical protein